MSEMPAQNTFDYAEPVFFPNSPAQLDGAKLIIAHDWDGNLARTYPAMCIVDIANQKLPGIFSNILSRTDLSAENGKMSTIVRWSMKLANYFSQVHGRKEHPELIDYFTKRQQHRGSEVTHLSQIEFLFATEEHKNALHRPMDTFNRVVARIFTDIEAKGIDISAQQRKAINKQVEKLRKKHLQYYINQANMLYPGAVDALDYSAKAGALNPVYTTTEAALIVLRIHDAKYKKGPFSRAVPFDTSLIPGVWAFAGKGDAREKIKWDATFEGFKGYLAYLKEQGVDLQKYDLNRLRTIYDKVHVFEKKKPNNVPLMEIWGRFMPEQEARVNGELRRNGFNGLDFVATSNNMLFIGESKSDMDSIYSELGNPASAPICGFKIQWTGLQDGRTIKSDSRIRGTSHLKDARGTIDLFGRKTMLRMFSNSDVLLRGYRSLLNMMKNGELVAGYRDMPRAPMPTRAQVLAGRISTARFLSHFMFQPAA